MNETLSAPLRIVHAMFTGPIAGSERYCLDLATRQAALGHEVHVVGLPQAGLRAWLPANVRFHALSGRWLRSWRLSRLLAVLQPDVLHSHLSAACKAAAAAPREVCTVATLHVGYKPHQHAHLQGLVAVNRQQLAAMPGYEGAQRWVPNWLPEPLAAPVSTSAFEAPDASRLRVVAVGRLHASKGMDLLIRAFLQAAPAQADLLIVGAGKEARRLQQLAGGDPRIQLLGHRNDVDRLLAGCDLFVSPSREESFGLALLEAMRAGLPVIASATEGPSEVLARQPARLVPVGDADALAQALSAELAQLQATGHRRVAYELETFDPALGVDSVLSFYRELLAARQASPMRLQALHA